MKNCLLSIALMSLMTVSACSGVETQPVAQNDQPAGDGGRPMDEVPGRKTLANGDREYRYANGCEIVLEPKRAVIKTEGANCQSHHRDISLLYASGD